MEGVYAIAKHPSADNAFQDSDSDEDELINIARSFNPAFDGEGGRRSHEILMSERARSIAASPELRQPATIVVPDQAEDDFDISFELVVSLIESLSVSTDVTSRVRALDQIVTVVEAQPRVKFELELLDLLPHLRSCLTEAAGKDARAGIYRVLRHIIVDFVQLDCFSLDTCLIRSLTRDHKFEVEKEQALRLIRLILSLPAPSPLVTVPIVRAIVALAESPEEKLRLASLQILGELVIQDIALLVAAEGMRVVLQALTDGPHDFSPYLAMGFTCAVDKPGTRRWLRPGVDIEIVLSSFTDSHTKSSTFPERVRASALIVSRMLKSWSGLMFLCMSDRQSIVALVESLRTSSSASIRETLIDMLFDIFRLPTPVWFKSSFRLKPKPTVKVTPTASTLQQGQSNLIDQYLAILLLVFIEAGFLEAMVTVAEESSDSIISRKVSLLIGEILQLSNRVLPLSYAARVQSLPRLFTLASDFEGKHTRATASTTLSAVDRLNRDKSRSSFAGSSNEDARARANSLDDPLKRGQRQVETVKLIVGMQIDDTNFRNQLLTSQVLSTKEHSRWSFDILFELFEGGPLLNAKRLDEATRATKFMRRVLGFYHPYNNRYSNLRKDADSIKWTRLAISVVTTLLANPDGVRFLMENKFLRQLSDCLIQLDQIPSNGSVDVFLSRRRIKDTLASGYFEILGVLSRSIEGIKLLNHFKIWSSFYRICELQNREDLVTQIIENLDYTMDGHSRVILSKTLTSTQTYVRLCATRRLALLLLETPVTPDWQIRLLLTQLYDPSPEVTQLAVEMLERLCESNETLEAVVRMRPSLDHLGEVGGILLTRFLSTSIGVRYLREIHFVEKEMHDWFHERNYSYMIQIELLLASALDTDGLSSASSFSGVPPPHFYGELVKTEEGCQILEASGHFQQFTSFIRLHGLEERDESVLAELKSVLWAVGSIGASLSGLTFLEMELIIQSIVEIAEDSPVFSLRGTAFYVLGLISCTLEGVEILAELGWESVCTPLSSVGICVPLELSLFIDSTSWSPPPSASPLTYVLPPASKVEQEAITAFANLSNHILATKASKTLSRLKERHPSLFAPPRVSSFIPPLSPLVVDSSDVNGGRMEEVNSLGWKDEVAYELYYRVVVRMLGAYHYRISVRRYIIDLFDPMIDLDEVARVGAALELASTREHGMETPRRTFEASEMSSLSASTRDEEEEEDREEEDEFYFASGDTKVMPVEIREPAVMLIGFD